jgi:hypothetical protein
MEMLLSRSDTMSRIGDLTLFIIAIHCWNLVLKQQTDMRRDSQQGQCIPGPKVHA